MGDTNRNFRLQSILWGYRLLIDTFGGVSILSVITCVYYSITGQSSVPSERLFSKAGELISSKRSSLKPGNVDLNDFVVVVVNCFSSTSYRIDTSFFPSYCVSQFICDRKYSTLNARF